MNWDDATIRRALAEYGTPFYIYDIACIERQIGLLRQCLTDRFDIALSLKANPNPNLLKRIHGRCEFVDVASQGEILLARMAGVEPERMIFVGPGKNGDEIDLAVGTNIGCIVAESFEEIEHISRRAVALGRTAAVALRVNPDHQNPASGMAMGGAPSQFGVDEKLALQRIGTLADLPGVRLLGIQVYLGTQVLDAGRICECIAYILDLAIRLQKLSGVRFELVDVGGGFGVAYFKGEKPLDLRQLQSGLRTIAESAVKERQAIAGARWIVEVGRFIFADAGLYCTSVLYTKSSKGRRYCILDGGSNFNASLSGMGKLLRKNFPFRVISRSMPPKLSIEAISNDSYTIVGPLCLPLDQLATNVSGPLPLVGDIVAFEKSGAYGLSFSPNGFLSHMNIQEIGLHEGELFALKRRTTEALLRHEFALD